jgi:hypothetical protein|eukprot:COSAG01_NODE_13_length_41723_cov_145.394556_58_plen_41_part_00
MVAQADVRADGVLSVKATRGLLAEGAALCSGGGGGAPGGQ